MDWFKCYNGATTDKKFLTLSRKFSIPVYALSLCWLHFCDHASQQKDRGDLSSLDFEDVDYFFGFDEGTTERCYIAFWEKGMIEDGRVSKWDDRQRNENAEKQRRYREKKKAEQNKTSGDSDVTLRNVGNTLPEEKRGEEKRKDIKKDNNKLLSKKRSSQIPDDWKPDKRFFDFADENFPNVDAEKELERFADHWRAKGEARKDWLATWRNWLRNGFDPILKAGHRKPDQKMTFVEMVEANDAWARKRDEERGF